jgi:transcription initiation factor TFIIIB Brf1 subunit/transcription initiation factor TFIIB
MTIITKLCGTKKSFFILSQNEKESSKNKEYFCKKCQRVCKEKIFLCYPFIKEEKS